MKHWEKYWFLIINIISFLISLIDGFYWRNAVTGFPIFAILGTSIASIIGGVYQLIKTIKNNSNNKILKLIKLWFTVPFYGCIGAMIGIYVSFIIFV